MGASTDPDADAWVFNRAGPFYALQRRLKLLRDDDLAAGRRALVFAALAFVPALLLATLNGQAIGPEPQRAMLLDFRAWAMVIAIAAFVVMEQTSDTRMQQLMQGFTARGLVPDDALPGFRRARERMHRRSSAAWVEALLLVAAYVLAYEWTFRLASPVAGGTWIGRTEGGAFRLTPAGFWATAVMSPLLLFLFGRWLWRFVVWGLLLRDIARCRMVLVATHADRCGGLAFIGQYPSTYVLFVFALSTVVSAGVLKQIVHDGASLAGFKFAALGVVVLALLAFVLPLTVFAPRLVRLKRQGLALYGGLVSRHNLAFERRWTGADARPGDELLGEPDPSSLADLSAGYENVKRMLPLPVVKEGLVPLLLAVLLPMVAVAATQAPVRQVLDGLKGLLLL